MSTARELKLLLVGPYPPPHGGISVHVAALERLLAEAGQRCRVLDVDRGVLAGSAAAPLLRRTALLSTIGDHAGRGWIPHLHTNGHNLRSWLLVLACGRAARRAPARLLTLHSGMLPDYLQGGMRRGLAALALRPYDRVICVNARLRDTLASLGVPSARLETRPAYLEAPPPSAEVPPALESWLDRHRPLLAATLSFRPEYGLSVLLAALPRLRARHPRLGCLLIGGDGGVRELAAARRLVAEHTMRGWVRPTGDLSHDLCLALIARCDVFLRPTLADGDALSVREALAMGVPVVASDVIERPHGVLLCRRGDAEDLALQVESALAARATAGLPRPAADADWPLRTYRDISRLAEAS